MPGNQNVIEQLIGMDMPPNPQIQHKSPQMPTNPAVGLPFEMNVILTRLNSFESNLMNLSNQQLNIVAMMKRIDLLEKEVAFLRKSIFDKSQILKSGGVNNIKQENIPPIHVKQQDEYQNKLLNVNIESTMQKIESQWKKFENENPIARTNNPSAGPNMGPAMGPNIGQTNGPNGPNVGPSMGPNIGPTNAPNSPNAGQVMGPNIGPTNGLNTGPTIGPNVGPMPNGLPNSNEENIEIKKENIETDILDPATGMITSHLTNQPFQNNVMQHQNSSEPQNPAVQNMETDNWNQPDINNNTIQPNAKPFPNGAPIQQQSNTPLSPEQTQVALISNTALESQNQKVVEKVFFMAGYANSTVVDVYEVNFCGDPSIANVLKGLESKKIPLDELEGIVFDLSNSPNCSNDANNANFCENEWDSNNAFKSITKVMFIAKKLSRGNHYMYEVDRVDLNQITPMLRSTAAKHFCQNEEFLFFIRKLIKVKQAKLEKEVQRGKPNVGMDFPNLNANLPQYTISMMPHGNMM